MIPTASGSVTKIINHQLEHRTGNQAWASVRDRAVIHGLEREVDHGSLLFPDLRVRVADFVEAGHSCRAAAQHFDVSESFAIKLVRRTRDTGSPARQGRPPGRGKLVPYETFLIQTVEARPAITMPELAARLLEEHRVVAAPVLSP